MEITFHGDRCFRLRGRDVQVVVDPSDAVLRQLAKAAPDVIVRTEGATDPDRLRARSGASQEVSGPGEYEVRGVRVRALPSGTATTMMQIEVDEVRVVALGGLERTLTEDEIDSLGRIDVLVVPVGGDGPLATAAAAKLVNAISPAVVVPVGQTIGYAPGDQNADVDRFAKEMGLTDGWPLLPKLMLSSAGGATEDTRVAILEAR